MNIEQLLQNKLLLDKNVVFGYLFGSYVNHTNNEKSDIDIALYLEDTSLDKRLQISYELSKTLSKEVDLVILNNIQNIYLLENIFSNGIIIKDHEFRFDYEIRKQHEILDFKLLRSYIDAA